jgi:hypothetical protein
LKPTAFLENFFKASSQGEAFSFKPFQSTLVFIGINENNLDNVLIVSENTNCKKKVFAKYFSGKAFD